MVRRLFIGIAVLMALLAFSGAWTHDGPQVELDITVSPAGSGQATPAQGLQQYLKGAAVEISAVPGEGFVFVEWLASEGAVLGDACAASTYAALNSDAKIEAVFKREMTGQ